MAENLVSASAIVTDALQKLNLYSPGEVPLQADLLRGYQGLIDLVDQWNDDSIFLYQLVPITINLQPSIMSYTIGPRSNVPVSSPAYVPVGPNQVQITAIRNNNSIVSYASSITSLEWYALYKPKQTDFPTTPQVMWYDPRIPWAIAAFAPVPDIAMTAVFNGAYPLPNFESLTDTYILAPGQQVALGANLAVFLNPYFVGTQVSPALLAQAQQSKTTLTYTNRLSRAMSKRNIEPSAPGNSPRQ
jgi:hypothetical protein